MKAFFLLLITLNLFSISKAQQVNVNTTGISKNNAPKFIGGIQTTGFILYRSYYIPGIDERHRSAIYGFNYNAFIQYSMVGAFAGITSLYNFNNNLVYKNIYQSVTTTLNSKPNCFNGGLFFRINPAGEKNCLYLYVYDIHYSQLKPNYTFNATNPLGANYNISFYKEFSDFITFSPRYRFNSSNNFFSAEVGLSVSAVRGKLFSGQSQYNSNTFNLPIGCNFSASFNVSAFFIKKQNL